MNGEAFLGIIVAGFGSWMSLVCLELSLGLLVVVFFVVGVFGFLGILDDLLLNNKGVLWVLKGLTGRSAS